MTPDHKQKIAELARKFAWELADAPDTSDYHARGWNSANAAFQAGAQALDALLAEPQAGHPPRVAMEVSENLEGEQSVDLFIVGESWESKRVDYISLGECQALRARDAAEIERVKADAEDWKAIANSHRNGAHLSIWDRTKYEDQLATERQARQAAEARVKKLEEALESIREIGKTEWEGDPAWNHQAVVAMEALAPLREEDC